MSVTSHILLSERSIGHLRVHRVKYLPRLTHRDWNPTVLNSSNMYTLLKKPIYLLLLMMMIFSTPKSVFRHCCLDLKKKNKQNKKAFLTSLFLLQQMSYCFIQILCLYRELLFSNLGIWIWL